MIAWESFGWELSLDIVSITGVWLDEFSIIRKLAGRRSSWLMILSRKKQIEFVQLDDIIFNWKLAGSRSSWTITGLSYKPIEFVQMFFLMCCWEGIKFNTFMNFSWCDSLPNFGWNILLFPSCASFPNRWRGWLIGCIHYLLLTHGTLLGRGRIFLLLSLLFWYDILLLLVWFLLYMEKRCRILNPYLRGELALNRFYLSPGRIYHWEKVGGFPLDGLTVLKNSSKCIWYWGDTIQVWRFRTRTTEGGVSWWWCKVDDNSSPRFPLGF